MAVYEPDSSATAVILCKLTDISYKWGIESFRLVSEYKVKIKVLKPEGTSYADVIIPYYELPNNAMKENIIGLDASAYNLENGKIVRTKMKKDVVFKERVGESRMNLKFSIPQVKAGTLIEYEYRVESDFFFSIDSWKAQSDIPILYTEYNVTIPEYFKFNIEMHGAEKLETVNENASLNLSIGSPRLANCKRVFDGETNAICTHKSVHSSRVRCSWLSIYSDIRRRTQRSVTSRHSKQ